MIKSTSILLRNFFLKKIQFGPFSQHSPHMSRPFTYLAFECEKDYNQALETSFALGSSDLSWCTLKTKLCGICRSPSHVAKTCPKNKDKANRHFERIYQRDKPANYQKLLPKKSTINNNNRNNQSQRSSDPTAALTLQLSQAVIRMILRHPAAILITTKV